MEDKTRRKSERTRTLREGGAEGGGEARISDVFKANGRKSIAVLAIGLCGVGRISARPNMKMTGGRHPCPRGVFPPGGHAV
jgi:hypothetical protein